MGICSHSVAAAELAEFIARYKQAKKMPNLTKFVEATMPKGRGRTVSEQPKRRKSGIQVEITVENPTMNASADVPPTIQLASRRQASIQHPASADWVLTNRLPSNCQYFLREQSDTAATTVAKSFIRI